MGVCEDGQARVRRFEPRERASDPFGSYCGERASRYYGRAYLGVPFHAIDATRLQE